MPEILSDLGLEIRRFHAAIVECHARPRGLDALPVPPGVHRCRVAPDELLLIAPPAKATELVSFARAHLAGAEPGALVVDQSDGWTIFTLPGEAGMRALRMLAVFPLPETRPAFLQGAVAGGSAKLLFLPGRVHLLVPFPLRDHLAQRLRVVGRPELSLADGEAPLDDFSAGT